MAGTIWASRLNGPYGDPVVVPHALEPFPHHDPEEGKRAVWYWMRLGWGVGLYAGQVTLMRAECQGWKDSSSSSSTASRHSAAVSCGVNRRRFLSVPAAW